jgi:hypothetical protein
MNGGQMDLVNPRFATLIQPFRYALRAGDANGSLRMAFARFTAAAISALVLLFDMPATAESLPPILD